MMIEEMSNPNVDDVDSIIADILWEHTCYPMDNETTFRQFREHLNKMPEEQSGKVLWRLLNCWKDQKKGKCDEVETK